MYKKDETTILVLSLVITLGLIGAFFLVLAGSTAINLGRLFSAHPEPLQSENSALR